MMDDAHLEAFFDDLLDLLSKEFGWLSPPVRQRLSLAVMERLIRYVKL